MGEEKERTNCGSVMQTKITIKNKIGMTLWVVPVELQIFFCQVTLEK
jgi:hypothetical protein